MDDRALRSALPAESSSPGDGPWIESDLLEWGADAMLWVKDGRADCVEIAATGAFFAAGPFEFELRHRHESGDDA